MKILQTGASARSMLVAMKVYVTALESTVVETFTRTRRESSFALVKRGIMGIYHNMSREHLHHYLWQFDFLWNYRKLNDGERTTFAIRQSEGKRLMYKAPHDLVTC